MTLRNDQKLPFIEPPVQGFNGKDPWLGMEAGYAIEMVNVEPRYNYSKCRRGFELLGSIARNPTGTQGTFDSLTLANGTISFMFGATGGVYTITSAGVWTNQGAAFGPKGSMAQFQNTLHLGGGTSGPMSWDGTTFTQPVAWTGTGLTITELKSPWVFKGRLYWLDDNNNVWFGGLDATSGALTKFPMQKYLTKGGYLLFGGTTNNSGLEQRENLNVVVSTEGQVIVFSGQDPAASDWQWVNTFDIGRPASYDSHFNYGEDLHIVTQLGTVALSAILGNKKEGANYLSLSRNVDPLLGVYYGIVSTPSAISVLPAGGGISNYENLLYLGPSSRTCLNGTTSVGNFVMNLTTQAWSWYQQPSGYTPISSPVSAGPYVYWVTAVSNVSYNLWRTGGTNLYDVGASNLDIDWYSVSAFTNDKANYNKKLNKIRPITKNMLSLTYGTFVDFDTTLRSNTVTTSLSMNKKFYDINQEASFFALQVGGSSADSGATALPEYYGSFVSYEPGSNVP